MKSTEVKGEQELPSKYAFVPFNLPNWSRLLLSSLTLLPGVGLVMTALDDPLPPSYPPPNSQRRQGWACSEPVALGSVMLSDLGGITGSTPGAALVWCGPSPAHAGRWGLAGGGVVEAAQPAGLRACPALTPALPAGQSWNAAVSVLVFVSGFSQVPLYVL